MKNNEVETLIEGFESNRKIRKKSDSKIRLHKTGTEKLQNISIWVLY